MKWVMDSLEDYQTNDKYMSTDLSNNTGQGDNSHVGNAPLLIVKYKVHQRWVSCAFTALGILPAMRDCPARGDQVTRPLLGRHTG